MEDIATLNELGTKILMRFLKVLMFIVVVTVFISAIFFPVVNFDFSGQILSSDADETSKILDSILLMIPQNIIEPFLKGNILQVIIIALLTGISITILGDRVSEFKKIITESKLIVFKMASIIMKLINTIIFFSIVKTILVYSLEELFNIWKIIAANYISFIIIALSFLLLISLKHNVKILVRLILFHSQRGAEAYLFPKILRFARKNWA